MNNYLTYENRQLWQKLTSLGKSVNKKRQAALKIRLQKNPQLSNLEYLLGAFMEMFEPHLHDVVKILSDKGYALEASSGFGGKYNEYQSLKGYITTDFITRNKLEKIEVKHREFGGYKCFLFWPEKADLDFIRDKWLQIANILPDKGALSSVSQTPEAVKFRRKYAAHDPQLQNKQNFEKLKFNIRKKTETDLKTRILKKIKPDKTELSLGLFIEELEPQVKNAVLNMYKKGYSTDVSGFMDNALYQVIEGDFQLGENILKKLKFDNLVIETNPSGYTSLKFIPKKADLSEIKKQWDLIISRLPEIRKTASSSMTRKAREFRLKYS